MTTARNLRGTCDSCSKKLPEVIAECAECGAWIHQECVRKHRESECFPDEAKPVA